MAKKPVSLLHLHEFLRKVWDERDKSKDDWDNGEGKEGKRSALIINSIVELSVTDVTNREMCHQIVSHIY